VAIKSGVPAVPIAVAGTWDVLPFGSATLRPGRVELRIAAPIATDSLTGRDREALTQTFRARVVELIGRP
jgi:1-acyl-sn-glycerol-3-phosphate acyltransferase